MAAQDSLKDTNAISYNNYSIKAILTHSLILAEGRQSIFLSEIQSLFFFLILQLTGLNNIIKVIEKLLEKWPNNVCFSDFLILWFL